MSKRQIGPGMWILDDSEPDPEDVIRGFDEFAATLAPDLARIVMQAKENYMKHQGLSKDEKKSLWQRIREGLR